MVTVISLEKATVNGGEVPILKELSLEVERGQLVAIIGPNGSGKSTLLRVLLGLTPLDSGTVRLDGEDLSSIKLCDRAARLAWLPQQGLSPERLRVEDVVIAARYRFEESRKSAHDAARRALEEAGATELAERWINELSGGERQRVELASMLSQESGTWLLDEPANHLDPVWRARTLRFLSNRVAEGNTVLVVIHDVHLLGHVDGCDVDVVGLRQGRIEWQGKMGDDGVGEGLERVHGIPFQRATTGNREFWIPSQEALL